VPILIYLRHASVKIVSGAAVKIVHDTAKNDVDTGTYSTVQKVVEKTDTSLAFKLRPIQPLAGLWQFVAPFTLAQHPAGE